MRRDNLSHRMSNATFQRPHSLSSFDLFTSLLSSPSLSSLGYIAYVIALISVFVIALVSLKRTTSDSIKKSPLHSYIFPCEWRYIAWCRSLETEV